MGFFDFWFKDKWEKTRYHLRYAAQELSTEQKKLSLYSDYEDYLSHNELELALRSLEDLVEENDLTVNEVFWKSLSEAAKEMKLIDKSKEFELKVKVAAEESIKNFTLSRPDIEAEIYYLTHEEGGRKNPVFSGYRPQFHYDGKDWDAAQQFIGKTTCNPGESVIAKIQFSYKVAHKGKLNIGKEFEIREGSRVVGKGKITKILNENLLIQENKSNIELHVAGAIVQHKSPFDNLPTPSNVENLTQKFIEKWVVPFYMTPVSSNEFLNNYSKVKEELNPEIVEKLLGDFNWRTRKTGAIFATLKNYTQYEEQIGNLFLKSEVCYAADGYCIAFASFNTEKSVYYLNQYLSYYLTRPELYFDQGDAMAALAYLDSINGTKNLENHIPQWKEFVKDKQEWNLENSINHFNDQMKAINKIKLI